MLNHFSLKNGSLILQDKPNKENFIVNCRKNLIKSKIKMVQF